MNGLECSEVRLKDVDNSLLRLESEYYQKKYLRMEQTLKYYSTLGERCSKIECGPFGSNLLDTEYKENGILVVRPFNLKHNTIEQENLVFISEKTLSKNKLKTYERGTLLFSRVGDIKIGVSNRDKITISPNIVAACLDDKNNSKYLVTFFNTKYGFLQIQRQLKVSAQPTISTDIIAELRVPLFENLKNIIAQNFDLTEELFQKSVIKYSEAEQLLLSELDMTGFTPSSENIAVKSFTESFGTSGRLDAEYYQLKYDEIVNRLSAFEITNINKEFYTFKNTYSEYSDAGEIGVVKTKQLTNAGINEDTESYIEQQTVKANKLTMLEKNDIVFASMGVGSLGKVSIYYGAKELVTDSTLKIYRKKPHGKIHPEVLTLFLQSNIGQELIYNYVVGSTGIINIYDNDIYKIPIPVISTTIQKKISEKVHESFTLRHKYEQLLENSKTAVEIAIEQGEEEAIKWLNEKGVYDECQVIVIGLKKLI
jgi:restriction endonuclease S subunit